MAIALAACDSAASNNYEGEVLATLRGVVVSEALKPPPIPMEVALVWGRPDGTGIEFIAEKVPITGTFPAEFTVGASTIRRCRRHSLRWKRATGPREPCWRRAAASLPMGWRKRCWYLDRDLPAGQGVLGLGGVRSAGFHLIERALLTSDEARQEADRCRQDSRRHRRRPASPNQRPRAASR